MAYLNSNNIRVYPTALRGGTDYEASKGPFDPASRLGTEFNLTNSTNRLTIDGSFVISRELGSSLEFCIAGYYFKVLTLNDLTALDEFKSATNIYAKIHLGFASAANSYQLRTLVSMKTGEFINLDNNVSDTTYEFNGVIFTTSNEKNTDEYNLLVLSRPNSAAAWTIPATSMLRFDSRDVSIGLNKDKSLYDVIDYANNKVSVKAEELAGHLTGNVTGNLDGNAKTATDSSYASHIGTSEEHPAIGDIDKPVYLNSDGELKELTVTAGSNSATKVQLIKIVNGQIQEGMTITYSKDPPSGVGKPGDIWYQVRGLE